MTFADISRKKPPRGGTGNDYFSVGFFGGAIGLTGSGVEPRLSGSVELIRVSGAEIECGLDGFSRSGTEITSLLVSVIPKYQSEVICSFFFRLIR